MLGTCSVVTSLSLRLVLLDVTLEDVENRRAVQFLLTELARHFVGDCFHRAFFTFLRRSSQDPRSTVAQSAFLLAAFLAAFPFALSLSASLHSSMTSSLRSILSLRLLNSALNFVFLSSSVCNSLPPCSNTLSRSSIFYLRFSMSHFSSKLFFQ